ncbi:Hypothetical predicted protein [Mytilus galloprovincialis]|uniref:BTB domain-containing protein n=1 Tax=Mytilus galloprovincialis TaxID=29158 RepID=A0A8B6HN26_MYTGA|nr:Hypothetical predicted protein [Mytilus galloprovincialis]
MSEEVQINVGGTLFITKWSTLHKHRNTLLGSLSTTSEFYSKKKQYFYFDRNPDYFNIILDFYRNGHIHFPTHVCGWIWKQELQFWRIPETEISECCYPTYVKYDKNRAVTEYIKNAFIVYTAEYQTKAVSCLTGITQRIWLFLEEPTSSLAARIFGVIYILVVVLSAITPMLVTYPDIREQIVDIDVLVYVMTMKGLNLWINTENPKEVMFVTTKMPDWLQNLDLFIMIFFSFEQLLRFISCPRKLHFFKDWLNVLDILLFIAMWVRYGISHHREKILESLDLLIIYAVCYSVVVFRLLRFFRITRQYSALRILLMSVRVSLKELSLLIITVMVFILLFSNLIYFAELREPSTFPNMLTGLWWSVVTMTTVGYGDVVPHSVLGCLVGSFCAMSGLLILAMPIAVIAGKFNDLYEKNAEREDFIKLHQQNEIAENQIQPWEKIKSMKKDGISNEDGLRIVDLSMGQE